MIIQDSLTFLESAELSKKAFDKTKRLGLFSSCLVDQLIVFLRAQSAMWQKNLSVDTLPYGTLEQYLCENAKPSKLEGEVKVLILFPWDFCSSLDWRKGGPIELIKFEEAVAEIRLFCARVRNSKINHIYYCPAPLLPVTKNLDDLSNIGEEISRNVSELGAHNLSEKFFNLDSYLTTGSPFYGEYLGELSKTIWFDVFLRVIETKKVIVTDLDETIWKGVLGEDGLDGVSALPEGEGSIHFTYQMALKRLKNAGILLAVVSKNDEDLVKECFLRNRFALSLDDFVAVCASYKPKSIQIKWLAERLNIGPEHFVFIDDNPIELEEVNRSIPEVTCLKFQSDGKNLTGLLKSLCQFFPIGDVTKEDKNRTKLYRDRALIGTPIKGTGSDLDDFLTSLNMKLTIRKKSKGDKTRAVQLINKTNQFNMNGNRKSSDEIDELLDNGATLLTGELDDKHGCHGEVIVALVDREGCLLSFVMSCRVFQRRAEFVFVALVGKILGQELKFAHVPTDRNSPFQIFITELFGNIDNDLRVIDDKLANAMLDKNQAFFDVVEKPSQ